MNSSCADTLLFAAHKWSMPKPQVAETWEIWIQNPRVLLSFQYTSYYNMPAQTPPQPQRLSIENCSSLENEVAMHPEESEGVIRHSYHGLGKPSEGVLVGAFLSMSSTVVVLEILDGKK